MRSRAAPVVRQSVVLVFTINSCPLVDRFSDKGLAALRFGKVCEWDRVIENAAIVFVASV
jgi:hypothetical protein